MRVDALLSAGICFLPEEARGSGEPTGLSCSHFADDVGMSVAPVSASLEQRIFMNAVDHTARTPVTLVSGFLGSGKSTLLNRLINTFKGTRFGIIVNEFGEIPLENEIIQAQEGDIIEFSNGCLCCVARNDLMRAVRTLRRKRFDLDHILVEASGLSDPVPVAQTFLKGPGRKRFEFGALVCVVDALRIEQLATAHEIVLTQLQFADFVYLTRLEDLSESYRRTLEGFLAASAPRARILTDESERELETLFAIGGIDVAARGSNPIDEQLATIDGSDMPGARDMGESAESDGSAESESEGSGATSGASGASAASLADPRSAFHDHTHDNVEVVFFESSKPLEQSAFRSFLADLPNDILRAKGVVHFPDRRSQRFEYVLQIAGHRRSLDARKRKRGETAHTRLLFLGYGLDADALRNRLNACVIE